MRKEETTNKHLALTAILIFLILAVLIPAVNSYNPAPGGGITTAIWSELVIGPYHRTLYVKHLYRWVTHAGTDFARNFDTLMRFNPSPSNNPGIANLIHLFIRLVQPLYILAILITAVYLIFFSASPKGRTRAKATLKRLIVSMFAFTLSPVLLELLLQISQNLTDAAFAITGTEPITEILEAGFHGAWVVMAWLSMPDIGIGSNPWAYTFFFMAWFPYMYISIRCIMMTILEIMFPLSVLLYSFNYTKGIGRGLLEQTIGWTVLQFFWALVLVSVALSAMTVRDAIVVNPSLGGTSISPLSLISVIPVANVLTTQLTMGSTTLFALMMGVVCYGMISALPFILMSMLRGFLP